MKHLDIKQDFETYSDILDGILLMINSVNEYNAGFITSATKLELDGEKQEVVDRIVKERIENFERNWTYTLGSNWIRVIHGDTVYAFVCVSKKPVKKWMKMGDILKPASFAQPSLNYSRGNVLTKTWIDYVGKEGVI